MVIVVVVIAAATKTVEIPYPLAPRGGGRTSARRVIGRSDIGIGGEQLTPLLLRPVAAVGNLPRLRAVFLPEEAGKGEMEGVARQRRQRKSEPECWIRKGCEQLFLRVGKCNYFKRKGSIHSVIHIGFSRMHCNQLTRNVPPIPIARTSRSLDNAPFGLARSA